MAEATPTTPTRRRRRRRLALALLIVVALDQLLCWTLATRPVGSLRALIELTHANGPPYYRLRPSLASTWQSWGRGVTTSIHTNALGFRDVERDVERAPGVARVIATGDSITFGIGVDDADAMPQQLARALDRADVEVWNTGVPGYAMADHLALLTERLLPLHPDVVVLQLSRNDSAIPMPLSDTFMQLTRFSGFARVWMIIRLNAVRDGARFDADFRAYVEACQRAGVKLLVWYEGIPEGSEAVVREVTSSAGVPLLGAHGEDYPTLPDDPHFSPEGNRRVAKTLAPHVRSLLAGAR